MRRSTLLVTVALAALAARPAFTQAPAPAPAAAAAASQTNLGSDANGNPLRRALKLLGARDLGTTTFPAADTPVIAGDLGFNVHTGGHTATPGEWALFVEFLSRAFPSTNPAPATQRSGQ